jgi:hypothetical protein
MALAMDQGDKFAFDKPAGRACPNLTRHRCTIHDRLSDEGFDGCVAYDCAGAGQRVTQELFEGASWRDDPRLLRPMIDAFADMRRLHDLLQIVAVALPRLPAADGQRLSDLAAPLSEPLTPQRASELASGPLPTKITETLRAMSAHLHR